MAKKKIEGSIVDGYQLVSIDKYERTIRGSMGSGGALHGGVGEDATAEQILAEYDRLGGLIKKDNQKVKTGCFYDFTARKPVASPKIIFVLRDINGDEVEVEEGKEKPIEVVAAEQQVKAKKATKGKSKK